MNHNLTKFIYLFDRLGCLFVKYTHILDILWCKFVWCQIMGLSFFLQNSDVVGVELSYLLLDFGTKSKLYLFIHLNNLMYLCSLSTEIDAVVLSRCNIAFTNIYSVFNFVSLNHSHKSNISHYVLVVVEWLYFFDLHITYATSLFLYSLRFLLTTHFDWHD